MNLNGIRFRRVQESLENVRGQLISHPLYASICNPGRRIAVEGDRYAQLAYQMMAELCGDDQF